MKVIVMLADTFRRDHLGAYGNDWIRTPNLDRFAADAALFLDAYIGSWPTVPTRRDIFLGRGDIGLPFNRWKPFERSETTLSQRLARHRIPAMMITDVQNTVTNGLNMNKGFTAWYLNRGQEGDPCWMDQDVSVEYPVPAHLIRYTGERWLQVLTNRAFRRVETDWFAPGTYRIAMDWMQRNYKREDFFLWIDTFDPHEPWDPPRHYIDMYDPGYRGRVFDAPPYGIRKRMGITDRELQHIRARYAAEATMVDAWAGQFLALLERLGVYDETLIVFTSDHGTMLDGPGDNGLLCKPNMVGADGIWLSAGRPPTPPVQYFPIYCNVARVPLIIKPPRMRRGMRVRGIVQPWDLTATILDAFGVPNPPEAIGNSLLPVIAGAARPQRKAAVCGNNLLAQAMTGRWIYSAWKGQREPCLLDLRRDPEARTNVLAENPAAARRLKREIIAFMRKQDIAGEIIASYDFGV